MGTSCLVKVVAIVDHGVFGFGFVCGVYDRLLACALEGRDVDKLVKISKRNKLPVARLNCWYNTNKKQSGKERRVYTSHFDSKCYKSQTDLCIVARVALRNWNTL
jgi:hypothetical protein